MQKLHTYLYLCIICFTRLQFSVNRKSFKLHNIVCLSLDRDFSDFDECKMKAVSRDITEVNVRVQLKQKPVTNVSLHSSFRKRGITSLQPIFQYQVDCCAFLRNKRRNYLAQIVYEIFGLMKYSNLNHTCPIDHDIIVKNWRMNEKILDNIPLPYGDYNLVTRWFAYNKERANLTISFKLYESN